MKHKIPLCIFLIIIIFLSTISNKSNNYEILTNQNKIILVGDSMLENSNYVKKPVAYNIEKLHGSAPTISNLSLILNRSSLLRYIQVWVRSQNN